MQLMIELTSQERADCLKRRKMLLEQPETIIKGFSASWLRVVGKIGPSDWLLADEVYQSSRITLVKTGDRDASNLKLASGHDSPWEPTLFDRGYWALDKVLADRVLAAGIKGYGIQFIHDFPSFRQVDCAFQQALLGSIVHRR